MKADGLINPIFYDGISGTWAAAAHANDVIGSITNTSAADGDFVYYDLYFDKGFYNVYMTFTNDASFGFVRVDIDNEEIASVDAYAVSPAYNQVTTVNDFQVRYDQLRRVKFTLNGKNGASSGFQMKMHGFEFRRVL